MHCSEPRNESAVKTLCMDFLINENRSPSPKRARCVRWAKVPSPTNALSLLKRSSGARVRAKSTVTWRQSPASAGSPAPFLPRMSPIADLRICVQPHARGGRQSNPILFHDLGGIPATKLIPIANLILMSALVPIHVLAGSVDDRAPHPCFSSILSLARFSSLYGFTNAAACLAMDDSSMATVIRPCSSRTVSLAWYRPALP